MPRPSCSALFVHGDIEQSYAGEKWARARSRHGEREVVRAAHTRRKGARLEWKAALGSFGRERAIETKGQAGETIAI